MRTYAEYLATMTVKTLNAIARDMALKGYSKLRKASLVEMIDSEIAQGAHTLALMQQANRAEVFARNAEVKILDVTNEADMDAIAAIMATVAEPVEIIDGRHLELINNGMHYIRTEAAIVDDPAVARLHREMGIAPSESPVETTQDEPVQEDTLAELKYAYSAMRATFRKARGPMQVKIGIQLRSIGAKIRAYGVNPQYV